MRLRNRGLGLCALLLALAAVGEQAGAQGLLIDRRVSIPVARSFEVREVALNARLKDQVAEVQVSQTFHNPGSVQLDAEYLFPLPEDGAIQSFVLLVDGKELTGRLMDKDEARRIYEEIVRTKRDPALLEFMGRGVYRTSVFPIPPGADRKVTMRYTQLCRKDREIVEFSYPFDAQKLTAKPIQKLSLTVNLESKAAIKSIYCPSYDASIDRHGDHEARISVERRDTLPSADFRLVTTLADGALGASVLSSRPSSSEDGFFLLLASPEVRAEDVKPLPKTVIFVLDRSGSMAGKKIVQARNALKFVLSNLRDDDTFNVITYDDRVESFRPELQRVSRESRQDAERFVENIREGGSTNIDGALKAALGMIADDSRPSYILFLTDGLPTAGEVREPAISENCRSNNRYHARLFAFGVGFDVNARLLDRLVAGNSGTSEYVKPDEDIEAHVARFYARLTSPVLSDIHIELTGTDVNRIYPRDIPDLFDGGQLVLSGRYLRSGPSTLRISGKVGRERRSYEFPVELAATEAGGSRDYVETLWATRRIGEIIDQIDLKGRNKELVDELVALSTRYGILTPYTSFLADERTQLHAAVQNRGLAEERLVRLDAVGGFGGVELRRYKQEFKNANQAAAPASSPTLANATLGQSISSAGQGGAVPQGLPALRAGVGGGRMMGEAEKPAPASSVVRRIGKKTFYKRGNRWIDESVTSESDAQAVVIKQFSDAYFKLARTQSAELNQYLAFEEPVTVDLQGTVYRIERDTN